MTDPLLDGLNPQQQKAVAHAGSPLLVVAGAGSGKTRVLTRRIAYIMARREVRPYEILAITFTNKAAGEMKERVTELVGPIAKSMWVSTFHSSCVRMLRQEVERLGYSSTFSIYDSADSQKLISRVMETLNLDPKRYPPRQFQNLISNAKNELQTPYEYLSHATNQFETIVADVYTMYEKRLQQANAMDFDDLIMKTVQVLQKFPEAKARFRSRFRHILVDEYQDTNHAQYQLVKELTGVEGDGFPLAELCVVGDADQSIYGFRGATIRNILQFEVDYPNAASYSNRIIVLRKIFLTQPMLSSQRMNPAKRRTSGLKQDQVHLLLVMSPNPNTTKQNLLRARSARYKIWATPIQGIRRSSIAPMRNLVSLKKSLCALPFLIKSLVGFDSTNVKRLRIYLPIFEF